MFDFALIKNRDGFKPSMRMLSNAAWMRGRRKVCRPRIVQHQEGADSGCGNAVVGKDRSNREAIADPVFADCFVNALKLFHRVRYTPPMGTFQQFWAQPQRVWLRKAIFQIHLWTGIGAGLYVLLISVSGSAIVFRNDIYRANNSPVIHVEGIGERMNSDEIGKAAQRSYPGYEVIQVYEFEDDPKRAVEVRLEKGGRVKNRLVRSLYRRGSRFFGALADCGDGVVRGSARQSFWRKDRAADQCCRRSVVGGTGADGNRGVVAGNWELEERSSCAVEVRMEAFQLGPS